MIASQQDNSVNIKFFIIQWEFCYVLKQNLFLSEIHLGSVICLKFTGKKSSVEIHGELEAGVTSVQKVKQNKIRIIPAS